MGRISRGAFLCWPALEVLPDDTVIDGEVVAVDETGQPSFNLLQNHAGSEYSPVFYVFDLLILAGEDLERTLGGSSQTPTDQGDAAVCGANPLLRNPPCISGRRCSGRP